MHKCFSKRSHSATGSHFPSPFLSCPAYLNDKSTWEERDSILVCSIQMSCFWEGITAQWQYRINMMRLQRSVKPCHQCHHSRTTWMRLGCVGGLCQDHFHLLALLERLWEEGSEVMRGLFGCVSPGSQIINFCRVGTASRLSLQGSIELQPVLRCSVTTITAAQVVRANGKSQLILAGSNPTPASFPPISVCLGLCLFSQLRAELLICFVPCFSPSALSCRQMGYY